MLTLPICLPYSEPAPGTRTASYTVCTTHLVVQLHVVPHTLRCEVPLHHLRVAHLLGRRHSDGVLALAAGYHAGEGVLPAG